MKGCGLVFNLGGNGHFVGRRTYFFNDDFSLLLLLLLLFLLLLFLFGWFITIYLFFPSSLHSALFSPLFSSSSSSSASYNEGCWRVLFGGGFVFVFLKVFFKPEAVVVTMFPKRWNISSATSFCSSSSLLRVLCLLTNAGWLTG